MQKYSVEQARVKLGYIVLAATTGEPSQITYHGIPCAVVISREAWDRMHALLPHEMVNSSDTASAREGHVTG